MRNLLIIVLLFSFYSLSSQTEGEFKKLFKQKIDEIYKTKGKYSSIPTSNFDKYIKAFPNTVLKEINKKQKDTLISVKFFLNDLSYEVLSISSDSVIRREACEIIVNYCGSQDYSIRQRASSLLHNLNKSDFSDNAKNTLVGYLNQNPNVYENILRVIGFLGIQNQTDKLNQILADTNITDPRVKWEIRLTLARLGDETQSYICTNYVMSQGIDDRIVHFLFTDLIYTRSKTAFDYLIQVLNSDELSCMPANPYSSNQIVCGYRIMEMLAPVVKDFPYKYYSSTGQLITTDYDKALLDIREWFKNNPDYVILTDKF